jgi:hypothetical protein
MAGGTDAVIEKNLFFFLELTLSKVQRINMALNFTNVLDIVKSHSRKGHEEKHQG